MFGVETALAVDDFSAYHDVHQDSGVKPRHMKQRGRAHDDRLRRGFWRSWRFPAFFGCQIFLQVDLSHTSDVAVYHCCLHEANEAAV